MRSILFKNSTKQNIPSTVEQRNRRRLHQKFTPNPSTVRQRTSRNGARHNKIINQSIQLKHFRVRSAKFLNSISTARRGIRRKSIPIILAKPGDLLSNIEEEERGSYRGCTRAGCRDKLKLTKPKHTGFGCQSLKVNCRRNLTRLYTPNGR